MKNKMLSATALAGAAALATSVISFFYIRTERCRRRYYRCVQTCDQARDQALSGHEFRRSMIEHQRSVDLRDCRIENLGHEQAISQCRTEVNTAADADLDRIDALDGIVRARYERCVAECRRQAGECEPELEFHGEVPGGPAIVEVDCIEGNNAPCFKPVLEICTMISGPCDNCWRSLCGDGAWSLESGIPMEVTLVAAIDPKKDARTLSTSSMQGKQAVLPIPQQIRLKGKEQLYLSFSSSEKPAGPVEVLIHRSRTTI